MFREREEKLNHEFRNDHVGSRTKTPSGQNHPSTKTPLRVKPPFSKNPTPAKKNPPAKTLLRPKPLSDKNPPPAKFTADKNSPPFERVRLHVVVTKN